MSESMQPPGARLRRVLSPEIVAGLLSVIVVAVTLPFLLQALNTPPGTIPDPPRPSAVIGGGPTASASSPVSQPSASATATATAVATGPETWASEARVLLQAATALIELRDGLASTAAERPSRSADIARRLRALNPSLSATLDLVDAMETNGAPPDLVADVRKALSTALAASLETLRASLPNAAAYRDGAADVIASLAKLEVLMARVEQGAGLR